MQTAKGKSPFFCMGISRVCHIFRQMAHATVPSGSVVVAYSRSTM